LIINIYIFKIISQKLVEYNILNNRLLLFQLEKNIRKGTCDILTWTALQIRIQTSICLKNNINHYVILKKCIIKKVI